MAMASDLPLERLMSFSLCCALAAWSSAVGATPVARDVQEVEIVGDRGRGLARVSDLLAPITGSDWLRQPSSLSVINVREGKALGAQRMVDLMQRDPSVELNYAPVGYYESLQVRGFAVDPVLGYRVNGLPVVGEMPFWMRTYDTLEFVRGPVGAWLGAGAGGGLINLVTLRPGADRVLEVQAQNHGGTSVALDGSWRLSGGASARLVLEDARLRPEAQAARGNAQGASLSVDGSLGAWEFEGDLQHRRQSQITQPGSQLLGGQSLAPLNPDLVLGYSAWSEPTTFHSDLAQIRLSRPLPELAAGWRTQWGLSRHEVRTDDRSSFPWGCSNGTDPYYLFCSNGDFTLWDYASLNERRSVNGAQAIAYGPLRVLGWPGQASTGLAALRRSTHLPSYRWQPTDAGYVDTGNVFAEQWSGAPLPAASVDAFRSVVQQRSAWLSWTGRGRGGLLPQPSLTLRSVTLKQGYESAFWTPRPWTSVSESRLLGAIGLSVSPSDHQRWSISWREDLEAGQRVPVTAANDGELLAPRVLQALELGYKWRGAGANRLSLTVFHSERPYDLRLDESPLAPWPGPYLRRGRESRTGFEWVTQTELTSAWMLEWTGSWITSRITETGLNWLDGTEVSNLPRLRTRLQMSRTETEDTPGLQLASTVVSPRWANRGEGIRLPGHVRLDAGMSLPTAWTGRHLRVQIAVQNLLDRRYWADASEFLGDAYLTPGQGRIVSLNLSVPL